MRHDLTDDLHDRGLAFDLSTLLSRRRALTLLAGAGLATLAGCASDSPGSTAASATSGTASSTSTGSGSATCQEIPEETAGPYPGDGSNGPNVLNQSGIVRSDIRSSFGSASGTAEGIPLTINLTILDLANGCAPSAGAAVYLWHCNRDGLYSLYSQSVTDQNYLRGVQEADSNGRVTFKSIFPAAYSGRLAAHPLRGLPRSVGSHQRRHGHRDLPARPPRGRLQAGLRHRRLRPERAQPGPDVAGLRQRLR